MIFETLKMLDVAKEVILEFEKAQLGQMVSEDLETTWKFVILKFDSLKTRHDWKIHKWT